MNHRDTAFIQFFRCPCGGQAVYIPRPLWATPFGRGNSSAVFTGGYICRRDAGGTLGLPCLCAQNAAMRGEGWGAVFGVSTAVRM